MVSLSPRFVAAVSKHAYTPAGAPQRQCNNQRVGKQHTVPWKHECTKWGADGCWHFKLVENNEVYITYQRVLAHVFFPGTDSDWMAALSGMSFNVLSTTYLQKVHSGNASMFVNAFPYEVFIVHYQEVPGGLWSSTAFLDQTGRQWRRQGTYPKEQWVKNLWLFCAETEELEDSLEAWKGSFCGSPADSAEIWDGTIRPGWFVIYKHWWIPHLDGFPQTSAASRTFSVTGWTLYVGQKRPHMTLWNMDIIWTIYGLYMDYILDYMEYI